MGRDAHGRSDYSPPSKRSRSYRGYSPDRKHHKGSRGDDREIVDYSDVYSSRERRDDSDRYSRHRGESRRDDDRDRYRSRDRDHHRRRERYRDDEKEDKRDYRSSKPYDRYERRSSKESKTKHQEQPTERSSQQSKEKASAALNTVPKGTEASVQTENTKDSTQAYLEQLSIQLQNKTDKDDPQRAIEERRRKRRELINSLDTTSEETETSTSTTTESAAQSKNILEPTNAVDSESETNGKQDLKEAEPKLESKEEEEEEIDLFGDDPIPDDIDPTVGVYIVVGYLCGLTSCRIYPTSPGTIQ